jgi:hypothetical protein
MRDGSSPTKSDAAATPQPADGAEASRAVPSIDPALDRGAFSGADPVALPSEAVGTYDLVDDPLPLLQPWAQQEAKPKPPPAPAPPRKQVASADSASTPSVRDEIRRPPKLVIAAAVGLALAVVGVIVGVSLLRALIRFGDGNAASQGSDGGGIVATRNGTAPSGSGKAPAMNGRFVVIDTPAPNIDATVKRDPPFFQPLELPKSKADVRSRPTPAKAPVETPSANLANSPDDKPRWDVPADPQLEGAGHTYAANLRIPLEVCTVQYSLTQPPVLADRDGPYAVFAPAWPESPYSLDSKLEGARRVTYLVEKPRPPIAMIDLRTGKTAGEFSWKSPFWLNPRLSPDGKYLVGPDAAPQWLNNDRAPNVVKTQPNALLVWKQKDAEPSQRLPISGLVQWTEFIANDLLAVCVVDDKVSLQIWNVADGKKTASIPLSVGIFPIPNVPSGNPRPLLYLPWPAIGAVSPGGRYVAIAGPTSMALVSLTDAKEVGAVPVTLGPAKDRREYRGLSFDTKGERLFAVLNTSYNKSTLYAWSVASGRLVHELPSATIGSGQIVPGAAPDAVLTTGFPVTGEVDFQGRAGPKTGFARLSDVNTGRLLVHHPVILRWSSTGPAVALGPQDGATAAAEPPAAAAQVLDRKEVAARSRPGSAPADSNRTFVYATQTARSLFADAASKTEFGLALRPKPKQADRSAVTIVSPEPPAKWTALPDVPEMPIPAARTYLPDWPVAFGYQRAAIIKYMAKPLPGALSGRQAHEMSWERYDAVFGKSVGEPVALWPWAVDPLKIVVPPTPPLAALSVNGELLAIRDPNSPSRVDVWSAAGERLVGFVPSGQEAPVEWMGFAPDDRLLTVAAGALTAWEMPACKAIYEVQGGYQAPVDFAPGQRLLAVASATHIDLIDTATGKCLGRCAAALPGKISDLVVAPGGMSLAAVWTAEKEAADRFKIRQGLQTLGHLDTKIVLWDLKTGRGEVGSTRVRSYALLHFGGPEHLTLCDFECVMFDLRAKASAIGYKFPVGHAWPKSGLPLRRSPDGRLWIGVPSGPETWGWSAMNVPDPNGEKDRVFTSAERAYFSPISTPLRLELDAGTPEFGKKLGSEVAARFQKLGYKIGPGGWTMRISHKVVDSGTTFMRGKETLKIPKVTYTWELLDPKGSLAWSGTSDAYFGNTSSKFYQKPNPLQRNREASSPYIKVEHFDFGAKDPREAVAEEILERGAGLVPPDTIPRALLKVGTAYQQFPVSMEFVFKKAP